MTLGTAPGVVTNWSDTQVIATVATGSTSGSAQVLQNGVWSNSVPFTINIPRITSISPTSGAGGTVVTITGVSFGSTQGNGSVWIGSTYGTVTSWSNTHVVASVDPSALSGIVKVSQNGAWSNAVTFTVPPGSGTPVTIIPNVISMVIGDTRSVQALNSSNEPATGLAWTSSNTAIATLSTDDPPIISAIAAGNVTITAGGASADLTVFPVSLPTGTIIWSNPGDGSGVKKIIPAVPSSTGVADVFALQTDGTVQAIASDGTVAWTGNAGANSTLLPDFQGGSTVVNGSSVQKLDGMTGQPYPAYTLLHPGIPNIVVHTDGTVFIVDGDTVVGVDPLTGTQKFSIPMTHSTFTTTYTDGSHQNYSSDVPPTSGKLMIAGDGYAYLLYQYTIYSKVDSGGPDCTYNVCLWWGNLADNSTTHSEHHARLLKVGTDGGSMELPVGDWSEDSTTTGFLSEHIEEIIQTQSGYLPAVTPNLITNADQGVVLSLWVVPPIYYAYLDLDYTDTPICPVNFCGYQINPVAENFVSPAPAIQLITTAGGSVTSNVTLPSQIQTLQPVLQAQDGTFFGLVDYDWDYADDFLASFDQSGNIKWSIPGYYAQIATADGGVIAQSYSGQSFTFDVNGNATGQLASLPIQSWTGNAYQYGSTVQAAFSPTAYATSYAAIIGGNPSAAVSSSANGTYVPSLGAIYRSQIASDAKGYVGNSTTWAGGEALCNVFVQNVLNQASEETSLSIPAPTRPTRYRFGFIPRIDAFLAADWANTSEDGACWKPLPAGPDGALPGDIIATGWPANGNDGTGHVGIVVEPNSGAPNYRDASSAAVAPYWWTPAQKQSFISGTVTLTDYGFRLPGFDFTDPNDVQGLKQDSHVRRFMCY